MALACRRARQPKRTFASAVVSLIFLYTTGANIVERPEGVKIAAIFIAAIIGVSFVSRLRRAFELRVTDVRLDPTADRFLRDCARRTIRFVSNEPDARDREEYSDKLRQVMHDNDLREDQDVIFVEITVTDPSDFVTSLDVRGEVMHGRYRVLTMSHATVPNALAALMIFVRDRTGRIPHIYFEWTEGNPLVNLLRFLFFGSGEVAPVTREVLREAEPDRERRPRVHAS